MLRNCLQCVNKKVHVNVSNENENETVIFFQWKSRTENRVVKNKDISVKLMEKSRQQNTVIQLIDQLHEEVINFTPHIYSIHQQYTAMKSKRESMNENEVVFHCDFSEIVFLNVAQIYNRCIL